MAALVHFSKVDTTERTAASATPIELTNYTIAWSDLTTAGFAAGDNVIILVGVHPAHSTSQNVADSFRIGFGTTYAGRVDDTTSHYSNQPPTTGGKSEQYLWVRQLTLVTNENIYFSGQADSGSGRYNQFQCLILNYDDLDAGDKFYTTVAHGGAAPTSYDTTGAGAATPSAGDWLICAAARFDSGDTTSDMFVAINDGSADIAETSSEVETTGTLRLLGTFAYKASLASSVTVRARFRCTLGTVAPTIMTSTIFGIRLNAFADHWGAHTTNSITHTTLDAWTTFASNSSYALGTTGPFVVLGWPLHTTSAVTQHPKTIISLDGGATEWPAAAANGHSIADNGTAQRIAPLAYGYAASQAAATLNIAVQCAEDDVLTPTCVEQVAAAFSLELAGAPPPPAGMVHPPAGRRFQHMIVR